MACRPDFADRPWSVDAPRVLAVRSEPAEAVPGAQVMLSALVASASGTVLAPSLDWALCTDPKPSTENNIIDDTCLVPEKRGLSARGSATARVAIPSNACQLFGPDVPPRKTGEPELRPRDPDTTGGYYQPVRLDLEDAITIQLARIRCSLIGASMETALEYRARYQPNVDPQILELDAPIRVAPGQEAELRVSWPAESAEVFPVFDIAGQRLVDTRESLRVSWFSSAGDFARARTGSAAEDLQTDTRNTWRAPAEPGRITVWVVLRDSRGGVDWREIAITVSL